MIKKQFLGDTLFLGGTLAEIEPLNWSVFNFGGTDENLRDLGNPEGFSFFSSKKDAYLKARAVAFSMNWEKFFPDNKTKVKGGVWGQAKQKAVDELDSFEEEIFVHYVPMVAGELYKTGYFYNDLHEVNVNDETKSNIKTINLEKIKDNEQDEDLEEIL